MAKDQEEETDDADIEHKDSDEEEEDDDEQEDESEESDEDDDEESDEDEDDDEDKKPVTRGEFKKLQNQLNANRRRASKGKDGKPLTTVRTGKPDKRVDSLEKSIADIKVSEQKRNFGYENSLSPAEVDLVYRLFKRPTAKVLKDPIVKGAIDALRAQKSLKENIPGTSGRTFAVGGKKFNELSPEDKQKNFQSRRQAELSRQGRA